MIFSLPTRAVTRVYEFGKRSGLWIQLVLTHHALPAVRPLRATLTSPFPAYGLATGSTSLRALGNEIPLLLRRTQDASLGYLLAKAP